ncbi:hypothetical protein RN001_010673 [Aquatica leii]|uniref:Cytochrome P450 n=1 Tax=Aquatica leii TaxID=1421715 RepID=A0AAN7PWN0_9COLE|nr:hypothetical protein RN001_010673 [Aquatica leii]
MVLLKENAWVNVVAIFVIVVVGVVTYFKWAYKFWQRLGVPYLEPTIPFGNVQQVVLVQTSRGEVLAEQYKTAKAKGYKHVGLYGFTTPEYMPIDLNILKNILVRDFNYFCDRGLYTNEKVDPLTAHLFLLTGNRWRKLRAKLTPTFTSGKMKTMFNAVVECSQKLKQVMGVLHSQGPINIKNFLERFTTDVIGSCAFGLNCNSFDDPNMLDEVMRKYPPLPILSRVCTIDYKVPNIDLVLKKGTRVTIPLLGIQNDPEYFPEPEKFNPERFASKNKELINQFCYMPFGEGPRVCIGLRFAFLQMKLGLSILLKNYKFSINEKTQLPLKMNPKPLVLSPIGSIWLNVEKV